MATAFDKVSALMEACQELRNRLEQAREAIPDAVWDAMADGPFGDVLDAAMDVEHCTDACDVL